MDPPAHPDPLVTSNTPSCPTLLSLSLHTHTLISALAHSTPPHTPILHFVTLCAVTKGVELTIRQKYLAEADQTGPSRGFIVWKNPQRDVGACCRLLSCKCDTEQSCVFLLVFIVFQWRTLVKVLWNNIQNSLNSCFIFIYILYIIFSEVIKPSLWAHSDECDKCIWFPVTTTYFRALFPEDWVATPMWAACDLA